MKIYLPHGLTEDMVHGKTLRWFTDEHPMDLHLTVEGFPHGTFPDGGLVLNAHCPYISPPEYDSKRGHIFGVPAPLDQTTVDKIEKASPELIGCGFVIFERSPQAREEFQIKR